MLPEFVTDMQIIPFLVEAVPMDIVLERIWKQPSGTFVTGKLGFESLPPDAR